MTTALGCGLVAAMLGVARLQPPAEPLPPRDQPARQEGARSETREELRSRLQSRLDRIRADEERIAKAIEALDAGKPVDEIRDGVEPGRGGRPGRGGGDGRFGGPGGRPGGGGVGGGPGEPGRPIGPGGGPPVERERILAFIHDHMPVTHQRIEAMRQRDPARADRLVEFIARRIGELMIEREPELRDARIAEYEHGVAVFDAAGELGELVRHAAPESEIEAARQKLRPLLAAQFDLRLKVKTLEIASLERRVERLRAEVEGQSENRAKAVEEGLVRIERFAKERGERPPPTPQR